MASWYAIIQFFIQRKLDPARIGLAGVSLLVGVAGLNCWEPEDEGECASIRPSVSCGDGEQWRDHA